MDKELFQSQTPVPNSPGEAVIPHVTWSSKDLKAAVEKTKIVGLYPQGRCIRINGPYGSKKTLRPQEGMNLDQYLQFALKEHEAFRQDMPSRLTPYAKPKQKTPVEYSPQLQGYSDEGEGDHMEITPASTSSVSNKQGELLLKVLDILSQDEDGIDQSVDTETFVKLCFNVQDSKKKFKAAKSRLFNYVMGNTNE